MTTYGDEILTLVEIDQPFCQLDYGNSPCQAQLGVTGIKKCYNSRFTCQDPLNYDPQPKTLKFSYTQEETNQYGHVIPSLLNISTSPLRVNIGSMDPNMGPFGERETVAITFTDHKDSDLIVDKYRKERPDAHGQSGIEGFNPYENGSFWSKWLTRNPYHEKYPLRIKEGVMGDGESSLRVRHYLIDSIEGPTDGRVIIRCKDLFSLIEERKAQAPVANTGELVANITSGASSLNLTPTGIGDEEYSNGGHVAISSEIIAFTRTTGSDTLTLTERGALNTTAQAHSTEDKVQEVLSYNAQRVDDIITDLLTTFTEIEPENIQSSIWAIEASNNLPTLYTANIAKPTSVSKLIAELAEQGGFTIWPDVETDFIELKAIGVNIVPNLTVDDDGWVLSDTLKINRDPDRRVSRVLVYYGIINPLEGLDDEKNYRSYVERRDVDAEDPTQYGTKSIRTIFSRWIPQFGRSPATTLSVLVLKLFRDPPYRTNFKIDIQRAGQLEIASPMALLTRGIVDDLGNIDNNTMLPMAINRNETFLDIEAQKLNLTIPIAQERIINIDDDVNDVNMRTLHDSIFSPASDGDEVTFIIGSGVVVGSSDTNNPGMETGDWPTGVILKLEIEPGVFLVGKGGQGGNGWIDVGDDGEVGGNALLCTFALSLINNGTIAAGGGGGGGLWDDFNSGGWGGGGGAGRLPGEGAPFSLSAPSNDGTLETGGARVGAAHIPAFSGKGGNLGQAGDNAIVNMQGAPIIGNGGDPGPAIDGDSLITHLSGSGTIIGAQIN